MSRVSSKAVSRVSSKAVSRVLNTNGRCCGGMAARKFGDDAGRRLAEALEDVADPERLEQVGVWIIECGTEADLLARVRDSNRHGN